MTESTAQVRLLKLAAAQRQLNAAIRMSLMAEDALATTTVAAAAYQILKDLKEKRGGDVLGDQYFDAYVGTARAIAKGEVPSEQMEEMRRDPEFWKLMTYLIEFVHSAGADRPLRELRNRLSIDFSAQHQREHWRAFNRAPNFLKHADHDSNEALVESEANPENFIRPAIMVYLDLMNDLTPEMRVWSVLQYIAHNVDHNPTDELEKEVVRSLKAIPASARGDAALEIISILKRRE